MLPPDQANGYAYPPAPVNPSGAPNNAYAAPPKGRMGYGSSTAGLSAPVPTLSAGDSYAPNLKNGNVAPGDTVSNFIPDPMQSGEIPIRTMYPDADKPPQDFYLGVHGTGRDVIQRHQVEYWRSNGWESPAPEPFTNAPNPRTRLYPEGGNVQGFTPDTPPTQRITARESQNTFSFTRPFDQRFARRLNGMHFSMADHRRNYPILGMEPARVWRNTSRVDPAPWDANIVDTPSGPSFTPASNIPIYEAPMGSQQFVFGG